MIALVCPPAAHLLLARRGKDAISGSFVLDVLAAIMLVLGLVVVPSKLRILRALAIGSAQVASGLPPRGQESAAAASKVSRIPG